MAMLPELEAYHLRLLDRAREWEEASDVELAADLARCDEQVRLLERRLEEFALALGDASGAAGEAGEAGEAPAAMTRERAEHRRDVLQQTRDLTKAYAHVLRGYLAGRARD